MAEAPQDRVGQQSSQPPSTVGAHHFQQMSPGQDSSFTSPVPGFFWNGQGHRMHTDLAGGFVNSVGPPLTGTRSASSECLPSHTAGATGHPISHSHSSSHTTNITISSEEAVPVHTPAFTKKTLRNMFSSPKPHNDPFQEDPGGQAVGFQRPDSISSDGRSLYGSSSAASFASGASPEFSPHSQITSSPRMTTTDSRNKKIPFHESPPAEHRRRLNNKPKPKGPAIQDPLSSSSRPPLTTSKSSSRKFSLLGGSKTPKQDYAGFCEGAYLMQTGKDGMKLRNQSVSMTGENNYWACTNSMCCFEGHAVQKKDENKRTGFGFDEDILEAYGLKYRWSFLAKSHTSIGNSKAGYEFQCAFCIGRGAPSFRLKGSNKFMEHVATHQGQTPNQFKMPRINYVVGRSASNWEHFDVNLPAPTAMELETMEVPVELEALEPRMPEMEAPLENPMHPMHTKRLLDGHTQNMNNSGLGIRMGNETNHRIFGRQDRDMRAVVQLADSRRTTQADRNVNWQEDARHNHLQNSGNNINSPDNNEKEEEEDESTLEQSWTHVRDSIQSLHPAPLFARKPVPAVAANKEERRQPQESSLQEEHKMKPFPSSQRIENAHSSKFDSYKTSINNAHPALRGQSLVHEPWRTAQAARPVESRQASVVLPEVKRKISTPDLSHPGTKWMD